MVDKSGVRSGILKVTSPWTLLLLVIENVVIGLDWTDLTWGGNREVFGLNRSDLQLLMLFDDIAANDGGG